ncbi:MAG: T9SS type A sorting domain-containing protein [Bacteroides sp.]|nr:T9SS type A sorting domain-containing protein [Bacteroides sp.]
MVDTIRVPYDSVVCRLVPIKGKYPITHCDSVWHLLSQTIDSFPIGKKSVEQDGVYVLIDEYHYDTVSEYAFEVHCREIDTSYYFDTITTRHCVNIYDTVHSNDSLIVYGPYDHTDTTMTFHPHLSTTYNPFKDWSLRNKDSLQALISRLNTLLATWPDGLREEMSLEDQIAHVIATLGLPDDSATNASVRDSLNAIVPVTPAYYRAWIAALEDALQRYNEDVERTQEYHIDSVRVKVIAHLKNGVEALDTFTIRTIPILYARQPDTAVQQDHGLCLWAGSPDLPDGGGKYANITWYQPINQYGESISPNRGFSPNGLQPYGDVAMADSVHIKTLLGQGGTNLFAGQGPFYISDTLDGDTLLFPIKVEATPELKALYPHAPEHLCSYYDTIRVAIVKGFRVSGFVSYASFWRPSVLVPPDTRSSDMPYDQDITIGNAINDKHRPIANVTVMLYDENGNLLDNTQSDKDGYFDFGKYYMRGRYVITGESPQKQSVYGNIGLNGNDATWVQNYVARVLDQAKLPEKTNPQYSMWWWASNVNLTSTPTVTLGLDGNDATAIQNKVAQILSNGNKYTDDNTQKPIDDWAYSIDTLELTTDTMFHVRGVMRGDADRNYNDNSSSGQLQKGRRIKKASLAKFGKISVYANERLLDFPVLSVDEGYLAGFQLFLYFDPDKIEPVNVRMPSILNPKTSNLAQNVVDDQILTTWISKDKPYFHKGDTILMLRFKLNGNPVKNVGSYFKNNLTQYVVSDTLSRIVPWEVAMPQLQLLEVDEEEEEDDFRWEPLIENGDTVYMPFVNEEKGLVTNSGDHHGEKKHDSHIISVIPNPISSWGDATYHVGESCLVNLKLYSLLGENVLTFVEGERQQGLYRISMNMQSLPSGIYILRLETLKEGKTEFDFVKVIIRR